MNRKKIVSAMLIVTLTCGLGLTACGGTQGSVPGTEEAEVQRYAWPLGSSSPEDTVTQIYAEKFAEEVDRLSGGSMKISVYPNSVLGGDRELLESCKDGDIPFVVQNTAPQVTFMKDTAVFDMPALFETIDAQENPYEVIVSNKLYEQQDYVVETNHLPHLISLIVSEEFFDSLTDEQQQIIKEAADTAKEYAREQSDARIASRMDTIRESGTEIITPSEELYNEIRELCKPIYASIENSVSQEIIDAYLGDMQEELQ